MSGKSFLLPNLKLNVIGFIIIGCFSMLMISCEDKPNAQNIQQEIVAAEAAFEKMATEKSIAQAFYEFADANATINRGELIHGRKAILDFYKKAGLDKARLQWAPDSVFVSEARGYGLHLWEIQNDFA